ncbi:hypothetical protein V8E52_006514 [Russula decolorans]
MPQTRYWMFQNQLAATLASAQIASSSTPSTTSASASALRFTPQPSEGDPSPLLSGIPALSTPLCTPHKRGEEAALAQSKPATRWHGDAAGSDMVSSDCM